MLGLGQLYKALRNKQARRREASIATPTAEDGRGFEDYFESVEKETGTYRRRTGED